MTDLRLVVIVLVTLVVVVRVRARRNHPPRSSSSLRARSGVGLVAAREIRERVRSRAFKIGTVFILLVVGAAIAIPALTKSHPSPERVAVVGRPTSALKVALTRASHLSGESYRVVTEPNVSAARDDLRHHHVDVVVSVTMLTVRSPLDTSTGAGVFVATVASELGTARAMALAHLTAAQAAALAHAHPVTVTALTTKKSHGRTTNPVSLIGDILVFTMLSQYNTWTLFGVMEEKSSRVIEVLMAAVRPLQLLAGKVLGIGAVALAQAGLIVAFSLVLSHVVGSNLTQGGSWRNVLMIFLWLVAGYGFYSWVYAAAGSMAERQDQVQSLAVPLSVPMLVGYVVALIESAAGSPTLLLKVLAYLPPTAPFAMPVLYGMRGANAWEVALSLLISLLATIGVARFAGGVYRRAILRTGGRVRWRDVLGRDG